jgi:hypothetical protein
VTHFGILKPYDLRQLWQSDEREFPVWIGQNLDSLGAALGMTLALVNRERPAGSPFPAVLAHDTLRDRPVVIESQLDETDHDHLGRLITFAAGVDACAVVWVTPSLTDPHRAALDWLNGRTSDEVSFFAVEVQAMQIDDSRPALNFKVAVFPNAWQKTLLDRRDGAGEENDVYFYRFNEALVADLRAAGTFSQLPTPRPRSELMLHTTHGGIRYGSSFSRNILRVGAWISLADAEANRAIFERLRAQKREIESALGGADLEWDFSPERRAQIVTMNHIGVDREDDSQIPALAKWAAEGLAKMRRVLEPRLDRMVPEAAKGKELAKAAGGRA